MEDTAHAPRIRTWVCAYGGKAGTLKNITLEPQLWIGPHMAQHPLSSRSTAVLRNPLKVTNAAGTERIRYQTIPIRSQNDGKSTHVSEHLGPTPDRYRQT